MCSMAKLTKKTEGVVISKCFVLVLASLLLCLTEANPPQIIKTDFKLENFMVPLSHNAKQRRNVLAAVWMVDFDQPLYFRKKRWEMFDGEANALLGLTRLSCLNGHVLIDSHPHHGVGGSGTKFMRANPHKLFPDFLIPLGPHTKIKNQRLQRVTEVIRKSVYRQHSSAANRYATFLLFENTDSHHSRFCHSGVCAEDLHSCSLQFLDKNSQDWHTHGFLSGSENEIISTTTRILPNVSTAKLSNLKIHRYREEAKPDAKHHEEHYSPRHGIISSHPVYGDRDGNLQRWEKDFREKNTRMEDNTMFPQHWFSFPGLYSMMQVGERMELVARLDDQAKDGFKEILDHEVTSFLTKLSKQPYIKSQELITEAVEMVTIPVSTINKVTLKGRKRRRRLLAAETPKSARGQEILYSFVEKVSEKLRSARSKFLKNLEKVKLEKPKKWRWQKNDPIFLPKVTPLKIDPETPMPEPEKKVKQPDPCLEPHTPESVAACIKFAQGPDTNDPGVEKAYETAYRSALNAERLERGENPLPEAESPKPLPKSSGKSPLIEKLEKSLEQIRNARQSIGEGTADMSVGVLKRLKAELVRLDPDSAGEEIKNSPLSLLEIGEGGMKGKGASCDKALTRGNCEIARNKYESNSKTGIYNAACVWCVRIEGGAEEGLCIDDVHSQSLKGYECSAFETGEMVQQDDSRIDTAGPYKKEPHASPAHEVKKMGQGRLSGEVLQTTIVDEAMMVAMDRMVEETSKGLKAAIESSVFRESNIMMTEELTNGLTEDLSSSLSATMSRSLLRKNTREITAKVVPIVTHILTATLGQALTRRPKDDYYCHYCRTQKIYCNLCFQSTKGDYEKDYYSSYFAEYYSKYYTYYYGEVLAEGFAGESVNPKPTDTPS